MKQLVQDLFRTIREKGNPEPVNGYIFALHGKQAVLIDA